MEAFTPAEPFGARSASVRLRRAHSERAGAPRPARPRRRSDRASAPPPRTGGSPRGGATRARHREGDRNPIGERIGLQSVALDTTVVGVVKDTKASLRQPAEAAMFTPLAQHAVPWMTVVVRTKSGRPLDMPTVRALVNRIDATVPVTDLATMDRRIADTLSRDRILAALSSAFAGLAALLCGLGLFGMMNFHVATRQREMGIRIALGAERRSIQWNVVREAVFVILGGAPLGLAAYIASSRVVGSFLFDLSPTDVPTVAAAACMLVLVALAASLIPARRATRLDPAVILRRE
jgi:putative ABC transport system permease protein